MTIFPHILNRGLAHVTRFSATPQHFPESVAEHSFYTAYIASLLCDLAEQQGTEVNREKTISMALVHDMEEMFSGDILTPFKHYSAEVKESIQKVNREVVPQVFENLPEDMGKRYIALWNEEAEGKTIEAQVAKAADRLSLLAKCVEEIKVGNEFFEKIYKSQLTQLKEYDAPWWEKIKEKVLPESD